MIFVENSNFRAKVDKVFEWKKWPYLFGRILQCILWCIGIGLLCIYLVLNNLQFRTRRGEGCILCLSNLDGIGIHHFCIHRGHRKALDMLLKKSKKFFIEGSFRPPHILNWNSLSNRTFWKFKFCLLSSRLGLYPISFSRKKSLFQIGFCIGSDPILEPQFLNDRIL